MGYTSHKGVNNMNFPEQLKAARAASGRTQAEMA